LTIVVSGSLRFFLTGVATADRDDKIGVGGITLDLPARGI